MPAGGTPIPSSVGVPALRSPGASRSGAGASRLRSLPLRAPGLADGQAHGSGHADERVVEAEEEHGSLDDVGQDEGGGELDRIACAQAVGCQEPSSAIDDPRSEVHDEEGLALPREALENPVAIRR